MKFHKMDQKSMRSFLIITMFDRTQELSHHPSQVFIGKLKITTKTSRNIPIYNLSGIKKIPGSKFLRILYPIALVFDIITFPIQYFIFPLGKNALG